MNHALLRIVAVAILLLGAPLGTYAQQAQAQPPPPPAHTGFAALFHDTMADFAAFPKRRSTWVILGVSGALAAAAHPADADFNARLQSTAMARFWAPGKYVGGAYVQTGVPIALYLVGRYVVAPTSGSHTNKWSHLGFDLMRAEIVDEVFVQGIKHTVRRTRPTGVCCSFPSGHAAATFALASVLERHLGYRFAWPTVVVATYVGTSRLRDNKHYLSDVIFGAGLGTAVGWTVVGRHGRSNYAFAPVPIRGGIALSITREFPTP
jgi:membrane-associated phospholipid phosphatase